MPESGVMPAARAARPPADSDAAPARIGVAAGVTLAMTVCSDFFGAWTSCCHSRYFSESFAMTASQFSAPSYSTRFGNAAFNVWWNSAAKVLKPFFAGCSSLCHELVYGARVPWPLMNVTLACDDSSDWSIVANCRSRILVTSNLDAWVGKPRRSKVGFSHGPR